MNEAVVTKQSEYRKGVERLLAVVSSGIFSVVTRIEGAHSLCGRIIDLGEKIKMTRARKLVFPLAFLLSQTQENRSRVT